MLRYWWGWCWTCTCIVLCCWTLPLLFHARQNFCDVCRTHRKVSVDPSQTLKTWMWSAAAARMHCRLSYSCACSNAHHADVSLQETRTYWFNPSSLEDEDEFMLVGLVLGLAIYNAVLLDFPLPLALYRKLIGQSCTLRDLQDMEPTLGKSLTALLQFEGLALSENPLCSVY